MPNLIKATEVTINRSTFRDNDKVVSIDMNNITVTQNSLHSAFMNCTNLTTVTNIPDNITSMMQTFRNCANMVTPPTIPSTVTTVSGIFQDCPKLVTSPTFPSGIGSVYQSYYNCTSLQTPSTIPDSVTNMAGTFYNCSNLTTAPVVSTNTINMSSCFSGCTNLTSMPTIPQNVTNARQIFFNCPNMVVSTQVQLPNSITDIISAFYNCSNITETPLLPNSITSLYGTFMYCTNITNMPTIPSTVTSLGSSFCGCSNLVNTTTIPSSVTNLCSTFYSCSNLTTAPDIPSSVTNMSSTFYGCSHLIGDITINSEEVTNAQSCFGASGTFTKNVFIPFRYLTNQVYTKTYNSFTSAGYDDQGTQNGVYLKDLNAVTLTINPTPADATVTLVAQGYTQVGNSITVEKGTSVTYTVSKTNYTTVSSTITVNEAQTLSVTLVQNGFTLTINPTPADATVTLSVDGHPEYVQVGNTITVPNNTSVQWVVSKTGYISQNNSIIVHQDETLNIELVSGACVFTVVPVPSNCQVTIMDLEAGQMTSGVGEKSLATTIGNTVRCIVSKSGYTTKTVDVPVTGTTRMTITLEASMATITLITNAPNPTIVLSAAGYVQDGNSITVPVGTRVDYIVSAPGYITRQNTIFADVDKTYEIILTEDGEMATLTIAPKPTSTSVTIRATGYDTVSGQGTQSMSVVKDTPVTYTVTYNNQTLEVDSVNPLYVSNDMLIEYDMGRQHVKQQLTYNETPSTGNHLIGTFIYTSVEGTMVVGPTDASRGTPLFYPKGEQIWMIFHTENFSHTVGATGTSNTNGGTSYGIRVNKILTVNFSPADAVVTVVDGAGNVIPAKTESAGQNTYYFPYYNSGTTSFYNNTCNITVSRAGYVSQSTTATRQYASDGSVTVNLSPES